MATRCSSAEQKSICEAWQASGLSRAEFCRQNNVGYKTLSRWLGKFKERPKTENNMPVPLASAAIKFLPVGKIVADTSPLEVLLPTGVVCKVCLPEDRMESFLWRLLQCK